MVLVNGKDYNGDDFNASTNEFGFGAGGHKEVIAPATDPNYIQLSQDIIADGTNSLRTTSTTSVSFGTGSKTWTLDAAPPILAGQNVRMIDQNDTTQFLSGVVTSFTVSTKVLIINVDKVEGTGSSTSWKSSLDGAVGATGSFDIDVLNAAEILGADTLAFFDDSAATNRKIDFLSFSNLLASRNNLFL